MTPPTQRLLVPLGAALAVLLVLVGAWTLGPGLGDEAGTPSGDPAAGAGVPGDPGPSPGPGPGDVPPLPTQPTPGRPGAPSEPGFLALSGFHLLAPDRLAVIFTNGVPECYGTAGRPVVTETAEAVTVAVPRVPAKTSGDVACIDLAVTGSVAVALTAPLGDRVVLDGAHGGRLGRQSLPSS